MTTKQTLLAHLNEMHAKQNVGLRPWSKRSTLAELQRSHGYAHHHYGNRTHRHQGADEVDGFLGALAGPNTTDRRPRGWKTGEDVVLTDKTKGF